MKDLSNAKNLKIRPEAGITPLLVLLVLAGSAFFVVGGSLGVKALLDKGIIHVPVPGLQNSLYSQADYLDAGKVNQCIVEPSVVGTVTLADGSFSAYRMVEGGVKDNGAGFVNESKIGFLSGDYGVDTYSTGTIVPFYLNDGTKTVAVIADRMVAGFKYQNTIYAVKILQGTVQDGRLVGSFIGQTYDTGYIITGEADSSGKISNAVVTYGGTRAGDAQIAIAQNALSLFNKVAEASGTGVLGISTETLSNYQVVGNTKPVFDPKTGRWIFAASAGSNLSTSPAQNVVNYLQALNQSAGTSQAGGQGGPLLTNNIYQFLPNYLQAPVQTVVSGITSIKSSTSTLSVSTADNVATLSLDLTGISAGVADGGITSAKIADGAVTSGKLADGTISDSKIGTISTSGKVMGSAVQVSSGGGLTNSSGLSLTTSCSSGQILKWNGSSWACATQSGGGVSLDVAEGGSIITSGASEINFTGSDFSLTDSPAGQSNISIDYTNSKIVRKDSTDTLTNKTIDAGSNTISGLTVSNLSSAGVSQFTNDSGYIAGIAWGDITGTISDQTDLQDALDAKADTSGLGSAAFTSASDYATSSQGILAANALPAVSFTDAAVSGKLLTGYVSGAGTVAAADTILQAIQKLNGNDATNANLTGVVTSVGNATSIANGAITNLMLANGAVTNLSGINTGDNAVNSNYSSDYRAANFVAGTNYLAPNGSASSLTSFPTFNQNTTGTSSNITGVLGASSFPAMTGDVTNTQGSLATAISSGAVTLSKMANLAANSIIGNNTGISAAPIALTTAQVKTLLAIANTDVSGLGTLSTQNSNNISVTGGSLSGLTSVGATTFTGALTGNASTATTLQNARTIAGTSFNGSANISLANKFIVQGTSDAGLSGPQFLGALGTGIVKNTTTTGVLSIAVAGDFPTLNQNTTGTSSNITGVLGASSFPAMTGDVTNTQGSLSTAIASGAVSLGKMANLAANSIIGNNTGISATPIALTTAQVKTLLAIANTDVSGLGTMSTQNASGIAVTGGTATGLTGFGIRSSGTGAFDLTINNTENLTAGRTLTITTGDAARTLTLTGNASITGTNTGDNAANSTYASDYRAANFVAGTNYLAPNGSAASLTSFPTLNQSTTGTASNITGVLGASSFPAMTGDVTNTQGSLANAIASGAVTLGKMANLAENSIIGNNTGIGATPIALTTAQVKTLLAIANTDVSGLGTMSTQNANAVNITGGSLSGLTSVAATTFTGALTGNASGTASNITGVLGASSFPAQTGDVTNTQGSLANTIASGAVTLTKMANLAANSIIGNNTGSSAAPIALSISQVKTLLAIANTDVSGLGTLSTQNANGVAITGGTAAGLTGLGIRSSGTGAFDLTIANTENLTAGRTLTITTGNAARTLTLTGDASITGTNTGDNSANSTYASDFRAANFIAGTNYLAPNGSAASLTSFPTLNQNTTGTASNITGVLGASSFPAMTGDVTNTQGSLSNAIASGAVTLGKMANLAANSIIGNNTGIGATPIALTVAQVKTLLAIANTDVSGLGTLSTQNSNNISVTGGSLSGLTSVTATTFTGALSGNATSATTASTAATGNALANTDSAGQSAITAINLASAGTINTARLNSSVTTQGNSFNGISQLVKLDTSGNLPALNGVALTGITGDQVLPTQTGNNGKVLGTNGTTVSWVTNSSGVAWGAITGTLSSQTDLNTALGGKLTTTLTSANIFVGSGTNVATGVAMSGDVTIDNTGATTIGASKVTLGKMANLAANSIIGNNTGSSATPIALTASQVKSLLSIANTDVSGLGTLSTQNASGIAVTGGTLAGLTGFGIRSAGTGAFDLTINNTENLTAGRTLTITMGDAARTLTLTGNASITGTNTGDNAANSTYASDYRAANFVAGTNYLAPNGSAASLTSFPTLNQNTTGTAGNITGVLGASSFPAMTGDVTNTQGSLANAIASGAVSLGKMANLAANSIIGNNTGISATPIALTAAQVKTLLSIANTDVSGLGTMSTQNASGVAITGGTAAGLTGFGIRSSGTGAFDLTIANSENLTAGRTLTITTGNAARTLTMTGDASITGTNTGDNSANSTYASDYRAANFIAGTNYLAPNGSAASLTSFPTLNQNTTGTSSNITGILGASSFPAQTGDVTNTQGSLANAIASGAVTLGKMANLAANSIIGNNTGISAAPIALTAAQVKTLLAIANTDVSGLGTMSTQNANAVSITGGTHTGITSLGIRSSGTGAFDLTINNTENLTAGRTLTITTGDAARTLTLTGSASITGTNTGDNSTNSTYASDFRAANFVAGTNYLAPNGSAASLTSFPTLNQNTTGTSSNITGVLGASSFPAMTGDVTNTQGSLANAIASGAVTLGKMANLAANSIIGNNTGVSGAPIALTTAQVKTLLAIANTDVSGLGTMSTQASSNVSITGGSLSGLTGIAMASGNFGQTGTGTFGTGTGSISLNGLTTLAAGKALIITGAGGAPTATSGTIWYDTTANKFNIVENGTVKVICNTTDLGCGAGGGGGISTVQENDVTVSSAATTLDFLGSDFVVSDSPAGEENISIDYANSHITRDNQSQNISSAWTFGAASSITLGTSSSNTGAVIFKNGTNANTVTLQSGVTSGNYTWTLPTTDGTGCVQSNGSGVLSVGTCGDTNTQTFTTTGAGTWTKPTGALMVIVDLIGGGGGGGQGGSAATSTVRMGGAGGGGGAHVYKVFNGTELTNGTESVNVATGGTKGSTGGSGAIGQNGSVGGNSTFGTTVIVTAFGGGGGRGGAITAAAGGGGGGGGSGAAGGVGGTSGGTGGAPGASSLTATGGSGGAGAITATNGGLAEWGGGGGGGHTSGPTGSGPGGTSIYGGGGGGGGGGITSGNAGQVAGQGGNTNVWATTGGGGTAGTSGATGTAGGTGASGDTKKSGQGGGGGGGSTGASTVGGVGGNGGAPGGAGGGGGASTTTAAGGAGGNGGRGEVRVFTLRGAGADLAEVYSTNDENLEAGDVVSIDPTLQAGVKKSNKAYDSNTLGIISTDPGLTIGDSAGEGIKPVLVALAGRVPVKVSLENGPIASGDLLTSSSTPGVAMKAVKAGLIIGQSLTAYDGSTPAFVVAFIKSSYANGLKLSQIQGLDLSPEDSQKVVEQKTLAYLVSGKTQLEESGNISEVYTDRLTAGLEVITPKVIADEIDARLIKADQIEGLNILADQIFANKFGELGDFEAQTASNSAALANLTQMFSIGTDGITISGNVLAAGVTISGRSNFLGGVQFNIVPTFNSDTAGFAVVGKGDTEVNINFDKEYASVPVVNASPLWDTDQSTLDVMKQLGTYILPQQNYIIVDANTKGFSIVLDKPAATDLKFSWIALSVKDAKTVLSASVEASPSAEPSVAPVLSPLPSPQEEVSTPSGSPTASPSATPTPTGSPTSAL